MIKAISYPDRTSQATLIEDKAAAIVALFNIPAIKVVEVDTTVHITTGFNTYFKMEGWNPITNQYETWHSMGTPLLDPPSGNTLQNIGVVMTWTDR